MVTQLGSRKPLSRAWGPKPIPLDHLSQRTWEKPIMSFYGSLSDGISYQLGAWWKVP